MSKFTRLGGVLVPVAVGLLAGQEAAAQSTASQLEEVVVTAQRQDLVGIIVRETVAKARSSITQEYITTQGSGQTIIQSLNLTPGLNFTNNDPYGSSGGNIRLRGFDGNRVSLTFDGIPLNDTGNYAVYTNQQLDPELIQRANVNLGTTDVDSPTASATGGTINYITARPREEAGADMTLSVGEFNYRRGFLRVDTGAVGPLGTSFFFALSNQEYDKYKGFGEMRKNQYNFRVHQPVGDDSFVSLSGHFNENRNNNIRAFTLADFAANGRNWDFDATCTLPSATGGNGTVQNDNSATAPAAGVPAPSACGNYYGRQINPSNTGNIRIQSSFALAEGLRLTVDPSFQYVLANGGSQSATMSETDAIARGNSTAAGVDFNRDGDTLDTVRFFAPSNTNTHRVGVTSSLLWDFADNQRLRVAYTYDRGRHRQSGEYTYLLANGNTENYFGGKRGRKVYTADGSWLRTRDRYSIAELSQVSADYRGIFGDLTVNAGLRMPTFKRELNQYCYTRNGTSSVLCTTQVPNAPLANGNVTFGASSTQYIKPFTAQKEFDDVLPNIGLNYALGGGHSVYLSYAEGFSAPRTDNLYTVVRLADGSLGNPLVQPETTKSFDLGYRFATESTVASVTAWKTDYQNRIVSAYDEELGISVDRNVGAVDQYGLDAQIGYSPVESLTLYASASYNNSEIKANTPVSATAFLPTAGKKVVETPDWTYAGRVEWRLLSSLRVGAQAKYVGERFSTDVNDQKVGSYTTVDLDAEYEFAGWGGKDWSLQLNVINLFDKVYFGSISSRSNAVAITGVPTSPSSPTYQLGAPQTVQLSLKASF
ncbi:MAG: hypothetical protein RL026_1138 [Pseudomonadota bacterium]